MSRSWKQRLAAAQRNTIPTRACSRNPRANMVHDLILQTIALPIPVAYIIYRKGRLQPMTHNGPCDPPARIVEPKCDILSEE